VVSALDLDTAKADYDRALASEQSAAADIAVAEADLKLAETNLAKASIVSPISGVVLSRAVDPGQTVAASLQAPVLFTIAEDLRQMEAQVDVDEADVGKVAEGQKATFSVDAYPDREFPAESSRCARIANSRPKSSRCATARRPCRASSPTRRSSLPTIPTSGCGLA